MTAEIAVLDVRLHDRIIGTLTRLPDDRMALKLVDSKRFEAVNLAQFERLAAKARLPEKITLDAVKETVEGFRAVWRTFETEALDDKTRSVIEAHLEKLPLWRDAGVAR